MVHFYINVFMYFSLLAPPEDDDPRDPVQHPCPAIGPERQADEADWLEDPQGGMDGPLHQQGVHEEEALLEAGHQVRHALPGQCDINVYQQLI